MTDDTTCTQCGTIYPRKYFTQCPQCAGTTNSTQTRSVKPQNGRRRSRASTSASSAGNDVPVDQWSAERDTALPQDIPADATCSRCDQPMVWEPSRTTIICHTCGTVELPTVILANQRATRSRTVAVPVDLVAELQAQSKLAGEIGRLHFAIDQRINYIDPRTIDDPTLADRCAELTGQLRYIRSQPIESESDIQSLVMQLFAPIDSEIRSISPMIDREREQPTVEYTQQTEPRELESNTVVSGELIDNDEPYDSTTVALRKARAKLERTQRNGQCELCGIFRRTAEWIIHAGIPVTARGVFTKTDYRPNGTSIRVCRKHKTVAIARVERTGYTALGEKLS